MPKFGDTSQKRLATCHPDIQMVMNEVIKHFDCSIICGFRGRLEQEEAFSDGRSKARFGESPHNFTFAVDVVPYPIDWEDRERMTYFAGQVMATARNLGIKLRWGGDWDMDTELEDNSFDDLPHFELLNWREMK
jgi:hypothetical protein